MTHEKFTERLKEIQSDLTDKAVAIANSPVTKTQMKRWAKAESDANQSLITLFEDYTKAIVGEEDTEVRGTTQSPSNPMYWTKRTKHRNELRQTINQTSKTILRGE